MKNHKILNWKIYHPDSTTNSNKHCWITWIWFPLRNEWAAGRPSNWELEAGTKNVHRRKRKVNEFLNKIVWCTLIRAVARTQLRKSKVVKTRKMIKNLRLLLHSGRWRIQTWSLSLGPKMCIVDNVNFSKMVLFFLYHKKWGRSRAHNCANLGTGKWHKSTSFFGTPELAAANALDFRVIGVSLWGYFLLWSVL